MASSRIIASWLPPVEPDSMFCEVGAGKSIVAELFSKRALPLNRLSITDQSAHMLEYSREFEAQGASLRVADADKLPLDDATVSCIISSLGDPYNCRAFWVEASRVLRPAGIAIFTVPSYEWARHFRGPEAAPGFHEAEFELIDGRRVSLPSFIYSAAEQTALISGQGLKVLTSRDITIGDLEGEKLSPKLAPDRGPGGPVVTGYLIQKS